MTDYEDSTWFTEGFTEYKLENQLRFAKLIKTKNRYKYFKIISNGIVVSNKHDDTKRGDLFCYSSTPFNMLVEKPSIFVTKKNLLKGEDYLNSEEVKKELEKGN